MQQILTIFTTEDVGELKVSFKEIILEQFRRDFEDNQNYLFDPNEIEEMIRESFAEVVDELRADLKKILKQKILNLGNEELIALLKPGKKAR